jgi:uncharacterized protein (DUF305 family)
MRATKRAPRTAVLALFLAAGCASSRSAPERPAAGMTPAEFEAIYRAREDSARTRFGVADVRFMTHMIAHHAQALEMAALVPERTASASIRTLAGRITNAQQDEIATMQQWLRDRGQPVPEVHVSGAHVMVHGAEHGAHMPGLLTAAQLEELAAARGPEFERLFLRYMIQHHGGAVTMVAELFATDGAGQDEAVFKFASDVQVDQRTEIDRMERMLAALSAAGAP